jgi:hypothetical protein
MSEQKEDIETRQERRAVRLDRKKERIPQHGRSTARVYKEAILKRINSLRTNKDKRKRLEEKKETT